VTAGLTDHATVPAAAPVDRVAVAAAVEAVVTSVPGVARLSAGSVVESATYHAGGKIIGVTVDQGTVSVRVVAAELPLPALAERIRVAVARALDGLGVTRRVDIVVDDVEIEGLPGPAAPGSVAARSVPPSAGPEEGRNP